MTPTPAQRDALTRIADEFAGLAHQIRVLTKESDDAPAPYILVEMDGATPAQVEEMLDRIATLAYDTEPEGVTVGVAATANPSTHPLLPAQDAHTPRERTQTRTGGTESGEGGGGAQEGAPRRRLKACVEAWPEAETMAYDPRCCRFPKSCSADVYDDGISEDRLEPMPAGREGGEDEPFVAASALGDKLRALGVRFQRGVSNSDPANDEDIELSGYAYWVTVQGVEALAAEVDRMAQTLDGALTSAAVFKEDRDRLRGQVERVRALADAWDDDMQTGIARKVREALDGKAGFYDALDGPSSKAAPDCSKTCGNGEAGT